MLSRIAESLYWIGRYTERAEDTARLLDVAQRAALEGSDMGTAATLAAVLGTRGGGGRGDSELLVDYCLGRASNVSIASCVRQARENSRTIREALPSEMWEALNRWHLEVAAAAPADLLGGGAHTFLSAMKTRAYQFNGVAEGTMLRDEGWDWLMLGRHLERLVFTCRVLAVRGPQLASASGPQEAYGFAVLLRSLSAYEAFRATHRAGVDVGRLVEFLLLDADFPRSALYSAQRLEEAAARVSDERSGVAVRRLLGRLRAELEFREVEEVLHEGLPAFAHRLSRQCGAVHAALGEEPFARGALA